MTPEQIRKRDHALKSVSEYWYLDFSSKEIRRKNQSLFSTIKHIFKKEKHTVWQFYVWIRHRQAESDAMAFPNQIRGDSIPIKGQPNKYKLSGGWTIPSKDLSFLTHGPLVSEFNNEILVPAKTKWERFVEFIKRAKIIIVVIISIISAIVSYKDELLEAYNYVMKTFTL